AELGARLEDAPQPVAPLAGVEVRVPAERDDAQAVPLELLPRLAQHARREVVRVEVLEEALDGADLDAAEAGLGESAQRLGEAVGLEADGGAGLDHELAPHHSCTQATRS